MLWTLFLADIGSFVNDHGRPHVSQTRGRRDSGMNGHVDNSRQGISQLPALKVYCMPFTRRPPGPIESSMTQFPMYIFSRFEVLLHPFPKIKTQGSPDHPFRRSELYSEAHSSDVLCATMPFFPVVPSRCAYVLYSSMLRNTLNGAE